VRFARPLAALALSALVASCTGDRDPVAARTDLIIDTLVHNDLDLIRLRPDQVAGKYAKMETTPQTYLRGTPAIFYRDLTVDKGDLAAPHGDGAELVMLFGDPHLENVGGTFDDVGMLFDCDDYDAAVRGPFAWDVMRAAQGMVTAARMGMLSDDDIRAAIVALGKGYANTMAQAAAGMPLGPLRANTGLGAIVEDLLRKAQYARDHHTEMASLTMLVNGTRKLQRNAKMVDLPSPFADHIADAIADYRKTRRAGVGDDAAFVIKDAVQRFTSGVASYANLRFWILVEGPPGEDLDLILELKEQRDPSEPIGLLGRGPSDLSNAARVLDGTNQLTTSKNVDPDIGWVDYLNVSFQVRSEVDSRMSFDVVTLSGELQSGGFTAMDYAGLGTTLGRLIATAHAQTSPAAGISAIVGDPDQFANTLADFALSYDAQFEKDYPAFQSALATRGPLLGARP
jgi:uncharacterized protein (DUF2252 family)